MLTERICFTGTPGDPRFTKVKTILHARRLYSQVSRNRVKIREVGVCFGVKPSPRPRQRGWRGKIGASGRTEAHYGQSERDAHRCDFFVPEAAVLAGGFSLSRLSSNVRREPSVSR